MDRVQSDIQSIIAKKELFEQFREKTVLVTGATGLIGSMLVKSIHAANRQYGLNTHIIGHIRDHEKARTLYGDMIDDLTLVNTMDVSCDYIIHTVSPTKSRFFIEHPVETIKASVESTMEALEVAKKSGAAVVYLSSMEQYGVPYVSGERMTEEKVGVIDHLNIRSSYSESKRLCECLCASYASEYGVDVKIARLAQTFGAGVPFRDNRMPMQFARAAVEGKNIVLHTQGKSVSNFIYLSDAISGIITILKAGAPGQAYNVCHDGETRSVREIAELICDKISNNAIQVEIDIPKTNMGYAPDVNMYLVSDKLRMLGWQPEVDMAEGYRRLVEYLNEAKHEE